MTQDAMPEYYRARLSIFSLVMINIIAVISLNTLPFSAKFGLSLVFYYLVAAVIFFIPVALVTAELTTTWPKNGGIYIWVREAFGDKVGLLVVWLQWIYNVVWYPIVLSLIAGVAAFLIDPNLVENPIYMTLMVLGTFWLATLLNCFGMDLSSFISTVGSIVGTLLPMLFMIVIGIYWLCSNHKINIDCSWRGFFPNITGVHDLVLVTTILYGLIGLEMSAVHAQEVKRPEKNYPRALLISGSVILLTVMLASLAVAIIIPGEELHVVLAPMQAFQIFLQELELDFLLPIIAVLIIIGAKSCVTTWIIGPTKGLLVAARDGNLPKCFTKTNKHGVPTTILFCQGVIVSILSMAYLLMPTAEVAYMALTELAVILALVMYVIIFMTAIALRYKFPAIHRPFKVPLGNAGMWIVAIVGSTTSVGAILLGFMPPSQINIGKPLLYQTILIVGTVLFCVPIFFLRRKKNQI